MLLFINVLTGNVYIADTISNRIRKVDVTTSVISTIAGTGTGSYSGDNGLATSATIFTPLGTQSCYSFALICLTSILKVTCILRIEIVIVSAR